MIGLAALTVLAATSCTTIDGTSYPPCYRVAQERPELMGKVFCHMPASPERSAQATRDAIQRNRDQATIRAGVLDAARSQAAGANP